MLLKDILENQTIELETSFKHHLMHDIIKGMLFLHGTELKFHGNLTSAISYSEVKGDFGNI